VTIHWLEKLHEGDCSAMIRVSVRIVYHEKMFESVTSFLRMQMTKRQSQSCYSSFLIKFQCLILCCSIKPFDYHAHYTTVWNLGKTITVLSLILQTLGLSTERNDFNSSKLGKSRLSESTGGSSVEQEGAKNGESSTEESSLGQPEHYLTPNNERIFDEYWKEQIIPEFRCQALTKLFSTFLRCSREINFFFDNYWVKELEAKTTIATVTYKPPLSLKGIRRRIDRSVYGDSLQGFVLDVESCFHTAISNNLVSDPIRQAGQRLVGVFRSQINEFKQSQIEIAIKSFSRASAKPDSMVAALIEKTYAEKLQRDLLPSSATLMVVPAVLVDHWMVS
jgi:hypothetical protein